jgi:multisubunit Na+/H+ antiporter MnhF subunit
VGLNQVTEEPLSLGFALLLLALGLIAVRVIIRPNAEDTVRMLQERLGEK